MASSSNESQKGERGKWLVSILGSSNGRMPQSNNTKLAVVIGHCTIDLTAFDFMAPNPNMGVYILAGSVTLLVPQDVGISTTGMIILGSSHVENGNSISPGGHLNVNCISVLGSLRIKRQ
jgi:predicted membrane protein